MSDDAINRYGNLLASSLDDVNLDLVTVWLIDGNRDCLELIQDSQIGEHRRCERGGDHHRTRSVFVGPPVAIVADFVAHPRSAPATVAFVGARDWVRGRRPAPG